MDLLDTRKKSGNLTGTLISDLVLQIFAYVAQTEREITHQRQAEGIAAAKIKGVRFGRPEYPIPPDFQAVCEECKSGKLSIRQATSKLGMNPSTFYRKYKKYQTKVCQIVDILVHLNEARNTNKISGISCFCHIYS